MRSKSLMVWSRVFTLWLSALAHFTAGQLDEIGAQCILIFVHLFLFLPAFWARESSHLWVRLMACTTPTRASSAMSAVAARARSTATAGVFSRRHPAEQSSLFGIVRNGEDGQLFQPICKRSRTAVAVRLKMEWTTAMPQAVTVSLTKAKSSSRFAP